MFRCLFFLEKCGLVHGEPHYVHMFVSGCEACHLFQPCLLTAFSNPLKGNPPCHISGGIFRVSCQGGGGGNVGGFICLKGKLVMDAGTVQHLTRSW